MDGNRTPDVRRKLLFLTLWVFELLFFLWKANKGLGSRDESLYLAIPYRFYQGDGMISGEWNVAMLSSWATYPLFWLYMNVVKSTEGIILSFRYIYAFVQAAAGLLLYHELKGRRGAAGAVLFWMLYVPFNMMALSYNTIGIMGLTIFGVILYCEKENRWWAPILAGVALSYGVLSCPYLVIVYIYYGILVFWRQRISRNTDCFGFLFEKRSFAAVTATCAALALLLMVSILRKASLSCIMESLPVMLMLPDHTGSFLEKTFDYLRCAYTVNKPVIPILAVMLIVGIASILDKGRNRRKVLYFAVFSLLDCLYAGLLLLLDEPAVNYLVMPVILFGLYSYALTIHKDTRLMLCMFVPSFLYSLAMHWASNTGYFAICSALSVAILPSVLFGCDFIEELPELRYRRAGKLAICVLFFCLFVARSHLTYWDRAPLRLNVQIEEGPSKGIYVTQEKADLYNSLQKATENIRNEEGSVLYFNDRVWLYLEDEKRIGSFSPWIFNGDHAYAMNKLKIYYTMHQESIPDWIFVDSDTGVSAEQLLAALELRGTITPDQGNEIIHIEK